MTIYHGGTDIIQEPQIISNERGRDFGNGFYCTDIYEQAIKWANRQAQIRKKQAILNVYEFDIETATNKLNFKSFVDYSLDWLQFVTTCRKDAKFKHDFDIVFGKIANDDVGETIQAVVDGLMPFDFALQKLSFMHANNQYAFCSEKALKYLAFSKSQKV